MADSNLYEDWINRVAKQDEPLQKMVRVTTKRSRRSSQFAEVLKANTDVIDQLINLAEKLADDGNGAGAKNIIQIIRQLLDNNNKLQQVVSDALQDIPS